MRLISWIHPCGSETVGIMSLALCSLPPPNNPKERLEHCGDVAVAVGRLVLFSTTLRYSAAIAEINPQHVENFEKRGFPE
jgi:hypothetical protein